MLKAITSIILHLGVWYLTDYVIFGRIDLENAKGVIIRRRELLTIVHWRIIDVDVLEIYLLFENVTELVCVDARTVWIGTYF